MRALLRPAALAIALTAAPAAAAPVTLRARELPVVQVDPSELGMAECPSAGELEAGFVVAVCRSVAAGGAAGPLHLLLVERSDGHERIAYRGPSAGDAYYLRPTVFQADGGPAVILAEAGAEFSFGVDVFVTGRGGKIARAGHIELGAPGEDGPTSPVPFVRVGRRRGALCLAFTRDLVRMKPDGSYEKVSRSSARYVVRDGRLTRGSCPAGSP